MGIIFKNLLNLYFIRLLRVLMADKVTCENRRQLAIVVDNDEDHSRESRGYDKYLKISRGNRIFGNQRIAREYEDSKVFESANNKK